MVLVLQRKLSDAHLARISVRMKLMKQDQHHIEQGNHRGQTSLHEGFQAMIHPLEATDHGEQRERGLDHHPVIPGSFGTQFAVLRRAVLATKAVIGQHDTASAELLDQRKELVVWRVHGIPIPIDHLAEAVEHPTELDPDAPAALVFGLFAELLWTAALPDGKQQLIGKLSITRKKLGSARKRS